MSSLIYLALLVLIIPSISFANEKSSLEDCSWNKKNQYPCLLIQKNTSNSSKLSKNYINKIIISKDDINNSGAVDLIDVFKLIPDVNITQSGPKGQQASIFMRGTGSNHTLVMINGVPINDQSTTQGLHDFGVDFIQTIQKIEVFPGSTGTHFGSNAIGGAINIILDADLKDTSFFTSDKDGNYEFSGNKNFIKNNSLLNLKFGSVKNQTISARGKKSDEKDEVKNYSTNINYRNFITNEKKIHASLYLRQTLAEYDNSDTNQYGYEGDNKMGTFQVGLEEKKINENKNYLLYYNNYDREYDERGTIDEYNSEVVGLKYEYSKNFSENISFGIGNEYKYDWGEFENRGSYQASTKGQVDNIGTFSNFGLKFFDNSNVSLFLRNDHHKMTGSNQTYKINLNQKIKAIDIGISYMNGIRNPTIYELFGTDNYGYSGNRDLLPEKSNTYEIYSNLNFGNFSKLDLRLFKSNIENNIEYIDNKYQNDNDDVSLNQSGMTWKYKIRKDYNTLGFFGSLISSKKENNNQQVRRPRKNYGLILSKKFENSILGNYKFNLIYNHYGKHFDTHSSSFNTIQMDSTDLVDLKVVKFNGDNEIFFKINNILGESYQRPHGYNQEGRTIKFGVKY